MYDSFAKKDAVALYQFLLGRGYILPEPTAATAATADLPIVPTQLPALRRDATPLTGVDMIKVNMDYMCANI